MRAIAIATVAAALGVAALPARAQAMPPSPQPICVFTRSGIICTTDILPLAESIAADPVGYVCANPNFQCGFKEG